MPIYPHIFRCDFFGKTLRAPAHEEEAALGAAIHGAVAAGVYRGYGEALDVISYD